jgi:hypothetical protein
MNHFEDFVMEFSGLNISVAWCNSKCSCWTPDTACVMLQISYVMENCCSQKHVLQNIDKILDAELHILTK